MINRHDFFMRTALEEAKKGLGFASPNPMVGAVIVKDGTIISKGYHKAWGKAHAEVDALRSAGSADLADASMYVTLEPCCHHGKTPPCTDALIKSGIKNVIIASLDEDDRVKNKSLSILRNAGINVVTGVLEQEALKLNALYFYAKKNRRPYIVLKAALTLDGKIAAFTGDSRWISNGLSRERVHTLRSHIRAIAVGKQTVITDRPRLNCRISGYEKKPVDKLIFSQTPLLDEEIRCFAENPGRVYHIGPDVSHSPPDFIRFCNEQAIDSVLIEGGGWLYSWFLEHNLVDCLYLFYKPSFLGIDGIPVFTGTGAASIGVLDEFTIKKVETLDNNVLVLAAPGGKPCLLD